MPPTPDPRVQAQEDGGLGLQGAGPPEILNLPTSRQM